MCWQQQGRSAPCDVCLRSRCDTTSHGQRDSNWISLAVQVRWCFIKPGYGLLRLLHRLLGKQLLQACEVAMEYLLALTHSPQVCRSI